MASTYSPNLRIELIGTGDQAGLWGNTTNTNLGSLVEQAIAGVATVTMLDANYTLTALNGSSDQSRNAVLIMESGVSLTTTRTVFIPLNATKTYIIKNSTTGGQSIVISTSSSSSTVTIANGDTAQVYCDGVDVFNVFDNNTLISPTITDPTITGGTITNLASPLAVTSGGTGAITQTGAQATLGVPSTSGSGASGTWPINISGNATNATTANTATTATTATSAVTADKLSNATGSAPAYAARAWVNFNGTAAPATSVAISGTYASPTSTTMTININNHGLAAGQSAVLNFTSGTAVDGTYTVLSVINANSFTIAYGSAIITSGNVNLVRTNAGTYSATGTSTITVSLADHGLSVGNVVVLDFTSGSAVDNTFLVASVPDANTFTVTYGSSITTSGTVNVTREVSGTYTTPSTTTLTVAIDGHGLIVGQSVYLDFTSGTAVDGLFTVVTTPTPNQFTVTYASAIITSGTITLTRNNTGTYTQVASTTVTVTATNHNLQVGHLVYLDFTSGTATDALFTVATVPDANTFTVTRTSASTAGNVTLRRRSIRASGNVASVVYIGTGDYAVNFSQALPDANYTYAITSNAAQNYLDTGNPPTALIFRMQLTNSGGTASDVAYVAATFFR